MKNKKITELPYTKIVLIFLMFKVVKNYIKLIRNNWEKQMLILEIKINIMKQVTTIIWINFNNSLNNKLMIV
jgi:hypothetical protein